MAYRNPYVWIDVDYPNWMKKKLKTKNEDYIKEIEVL